MVTNTKESMTTAQKVFPVWIQDRATQAKIRNVKKEIFSQYLRTQMISGLTIASPKFELGIACIQQLIK